MPTTRSRPTRAPAGDLMTLVAAAAAAHVHWRAAWDDALRGRLKAEQIAGRWYCRRADVEAWIAARAARAPAPAAT